MKEERQCVYRNTSRDGLLVFAVLLLWILPGFFRAIPEAAAEDKGSGPNLVTAIQEVARKAIPAVVHIEVTERRMVANPLLPFQNDPFFRHFFDLPKNMPKKLQREMVGVGSGIIIDPEGHIVTDSHVVAGANKILVILANGQTFSDKDVRVVGTDPKTDVAVLQISAGGNLPYLTFGDSDKMDVGQWVVAIGHPRGLDQTVTQGIISAKHRRGITDPSSYQDFLQTDAAINPGNSGGPLLDLKGLVIGINTAIMSESGGFEGLGFAVPSNMAIHITRELIAHGRVERGWMGISFQDLTPELARSFGLSISKGVLIADVVKGGPADQGGLRRGDVVTAYQGKPVPDADTLRNNVAHAAIGRDVMLTVLRNGNKQDFRIKIGTPQEESAALGSSLKARLGGSFRPLTSKETSRYALTSGQGIVVTWLEAKGPLQKAGFEVGDVILEVNDKAIDSPEALADLVSSRQPRSKLTVLAVDHKTGESGYVRVELR